jgi:hypothetical protein
MSSRLLLGRVQAGARPLSNGKGVNDTYVGLVDVEELGPVRAYIKDLPAKQLANELLAALLAKHIGLPIPRPILAVTSAADLAAKHGPKIAGEHLVFASSDEGAQSALLMINGGNLEIARLRELLLAWSSLPQAISFDTWIANGDRHHGNLLIKNGQPCLVDHSHAFTGPNWNASTLAATPQVKNQLALTLRYHLAPDPHFSAFMAKVDDCQTSFSHVDLGKELLNSHLGSMVTQDDLTALKTYLSNRCPTVAQHIAAALGRPRLS